MTSPEKYQRFKEISRPTIEKMVKLGILFNDITEKERLTVAPEEIQEQLEILRAQRKQQQQRTGAAANVTEEKEIDERIKEEIFNTLLRKKVFDRIASYATIQYQPTTTTGPSEDTL